MKLKDYRTKNKLSCSELARKIANTLNIIKSNPEDDSVFKNFQRNLAGLILELIFRVSLFIIIIRTLYVTYVKFCKLL